MKFENTEVWGFEHALRGMRNPKNSWNKSDSEVTPITEDIYRQSYVPEEFVLGINDHNLMQRLAKAGTDHRKFMRMI